MRSFITLLLCAFLSVCQAIESPDIYSLTDTAGSSPSLGETSLSPQVPSKSRHASGPSSGLNIFLPDYTADPNWLPLVASLKTVGLQIKVSTSLNISSQCRNLLVYVSPDVSYSPSSADVSTLTTFVSNGGNLIFMNQVPSALQSLAGVSASTVAAAGSRSVIALQNNVETTVQAFKGFNFTDYYETHLAFYENYTSQGLVNVGYTATSGAQTIGKYLVRNDAGVDSADTSATNAAIVKYQPSGASGHVYSFGVDIGYLYIQAQSESGNYGPWYDGHYFPGYDIGTRIIKNIVASSAHFVSLWTVPYNKGLAFTTTWDIDTYVSYPHGQGIAAAAMERGARGNLNLHTKYITDAYEAAYFQYGVPYINQIAGFRNAEDGNPYIDFGSHSVSHSPNAVDFPYGSSDEQYIQGSTSGYAPYIHQCSSTTSDGTPNNGESCTQGGTSGLSFWTSGATASGEVRVSAYLIRQLLNTFDGTNYNLTTYRPGNLAWNKYQSDHCVANGFIGGSSTAGNDHITHLPFQVLHNREPFQELQYFEFPLQWSDGDGNMSSADFPGSDFNMQVNYIKQMATYGGHYNILIHPSDAMFDKIQIQRALHDAVRPFAVFFNQTGIANWWTNRDRALVDITSAGNSSVTMTVQLDGVTEGLTLQVPTTYTFKSATGGLSVCQQVSYDTNTNAVILRNTSKGLFTLTFSVGSSGSSVSNCPDFTPQPIEECVAWDVAIDDFLELWFYTNGVNLLLLQTTTTGLSSNNENGRLQLTATSNDGVNSYYSEISRFCFDASLYTHLYFDTVIPAGSTYYVQLVSFDSGCNTEAASSTYLDVTQYAAADGANHTVTIPLSDFVGQDMQHVRAIRIGNISPAQTSIYIDNLKIQKRCTTAPGEDKTQGLAIESFQNVDRWITGINNIFGNTDSSMKFSRLAELGRMQLLPADSSSYYYTSTQVNGVNLDATKYTSVSINVRGPSGGSFDVVVNSGSDNATSKVSSSSYASLSQDAFSNITIPLSAFSGIDVSSVGRITLNNFTPNGGSSASNFTVRWVSLLGGSTNGTTVSSCNAATGYVLNDFCDAAEFTSQTNALGGAFSDDGTMQYYNQTTSGNINLVAKDSTSYFYSLLASSGCGTMNSSYDSVVITVSGPQGATADIGFKHGGSSCVTNVATTYMSITFNAARTEITIPFSGFPSSFDQNYLQAFVMTNFSAPGETYNVYSVVFTGPAQEKGCTRCEGTILNTCTYATDVPRTNQLLGDMTDESTLSSYTVASDGSLALGTNANAYWYSLFGSQTCYDAANKVNATGLQLSLAAPAGTTFNVQMRYKTDVNCSVTSSAISVPITDYITFSGNTSYQVAQIPFTDFPGLNASRLDSIALSGFSPANTVDVGCISLVTIATAKTTPTCNCPSSGWLNYCSSGTANRNAYGGVQSDDGTMRATPALVNGALSLQPNSSSSYWYSLQSCRNIASASTLNFNISATAGATFDIQLQSSGNGCNDTSSLTKVTVSSSAYGSMTGSPVSLSIPLSAFTSGNSAFSLSSIYAVVLQNFSSGTASYNISCAYFGNSTTTKRDDMSPVPNLFEIDAA